VDTSARATGAWLEGDDLGERRLVEVASGRPFSLEAGGRLSTVEVACETWGTLAEDGSNAILVCHALTGDSHAASAQQPLAAQRGWWHGLIGPGLAIDTDRWFVVCSNVLGGCQGTTGPASLDPETGMRYGSSFPLVTIRDMVRAQAGMAAELGINRWAAVVGGSMGGMQALEWAIMFPQRVGALVAIATAGLASAQQIAWSRVGRQAIRLDPAFADGDYYEGHGRGPVDGLGLAREIGMIHYRSGADFDQRFGRKGLERVEGFGLWDEFEVARYLGHHGAKIGQRFDANSYLVLNRAMDLHDLGRGRGLERAMIRLEAPALIGSIDSDILYPPHQQAVLVELLSSLDHDVRSFLINSSAGHDAFLIEIDQVAAAVGPFLDQRAGCGSASRHLQPMEVTGDI